MGNYSMPRYFQNMPVVGKPVRANAENVAELKAIEEEIHAQIVKGLENGKADKNHAASSTEYGAASTTEYGHTKLYSGIDSDSESLAATPKAVKAGIEEAKLIPIAGSDKKGYFEVSTDGILCVKEA